MSDLLSSRLYDNTNFYKSFCPIASVLDASGCLRQK
jgi:hypothetical protein